MGVKGAIGPQAVTKGLEHAIESAAENFGIKRDDILIGFRREPPEIDGYELYIYYSGCSVEYWRREGNHWVNWCYRW